MRLSSCQWTGLKEQTPVPSMVLKPACTVYVLSSYLLVGHRGPRVGLHVATKGWRPRRKSGCLMTLWSRVSPILDDTGLRAAKGFVVSSPWL